MSYIVLKNAFKKLCRSIIYEINMYKNLINIYIQIKYYPPLKNYKTLTVKIIKQ
jgi:hypothetical protein